MLFFCGIEPLFCLEWLNEPRATGEQEPIVKCEYFTSNRLSLFFDMNIFWALLRAHFSHHLMAWIKMSLSQAQNIIIPLNINSIVLFDFRSLQIYFQAKNQHPTKVHYRLLSSVATRLCQILSWHRHYLWNLKVLWVSWCRITLRLTIKPVFNSEFWKWNVGTFLWTNFLKFLVWTNLHWKN